MEGVFNGEREMGEEEGEDNFEEMEEVMLPLGESMFMATQCFNDFLFR